MANTNVQFQCPSGLTLTAQLYSATSDIIVNGAGDTCTEATNAKGWYSFVVAEPISGVYKVVIKSGSSVIGNGWVNLNDDTGTYRIVSSYLEASLFTGLNTNVNTANTNINALTTKFSTITQSNITNIVSSISKCVVLTKPVTGGSDQFDTIVFVSPADSQLFSVGDNVFLSKAPSNPTKIVAITTGTGAIQLLNDNPVFEEDLPVTISKFVYTIRSSDHADQRLATADEIANIPTNPLLTNDSRLNNLGAPVNVGVALSSIVPSSTVVSDDLSINQYEGLTQIWSITDSSGNALNLTGQDILFVAHKEKTEPIVNADNTIVGTGGSGTVTISFDGSTDTNTSYRGFYTIYTNYNSDTTRKKIAHGKYFINPGPAPEEL